MIAALIGGWELIIIFTLLGMVGFVVVGFIFLVSWLSRKSHTPGNSEAKAAKLPLTSESLEACPPHTAGECKSAISASGPCAASISEEALYEQAMHEVKSGTQRAGLWAKAFAEADGDERRQTALYLKYRVDQEQKNAQPARLNPHPSTVGSDQRGITIKIGGKKESGAVCIKCKRPIGFWEQVWTGDRICRHCR